VVVVLLAALVGGLAWTGHEDAHATRTERCRTIAAASESRRDLVTGAGPRVAVIGDSYTQGADLADPEDSWPSRLDGRVVADGFAGSGFSEAASACPDVDFAARVPGARRTRPDLVVVQGGLNDFDVAPAALRAGAERTLRLLAGHRVLLVGPPAAPRRAEAVPAVDRLLAEVAADHDVPYLSTAGWDLEYLPDRLHLTPAGHRAFGDAVDAAVQSTLRGGA
jgi:acyl-CoA thioesterase-1